MIINYKEFCTLESKKSQEDFFKKADALIKKYSTSSKDEDSRTEYIIKTSAGDYAVTLNKHENGKVYSIFGRFEDLEKAKKDEYIKQMIGLSGKANFHAHTAEEALDEFKKFAEKITKK